MSISGPSSVVSSLWLSNYALVSNEFCTLVIPPAFPFAKYHYSRNSLWNKTELRTLLSWFLSYFSSAVTFLVFFWLETNVHTEWMVGWLTYWNCLSQDQRNVGQLDSLCIYVVVSGSLWSRDNMFLMRRLRKAEVHSSKIKQLLFTVFKMLTIKIKKFSSNIFLIKCPIHWFSDFPRLF